MTQRRVENTRVHFWKFSPVSVKSETFTLIFFSNKNPCSENDTPGNIDEPGIRVPAGNVKQTRIYWFKVYGDVYRVSGQPRWYPVQDFVKNF